MNSFSIFYLLPLFCVSFAPAQANREKVCKLASASVLDSVNQGNSKTFNGNNIQLYTSYKTSVKKTFFQIEGSWRNKSDEFEMNPRSSVFVEKEIMARNNNIIARMTLEGDTFQFYRKVFSNHEFPEDLYVTTFTLDGKTLDMAAIKVKRDENVWIFMAVSGSTPRLVFPSSSVKSMSHNKANNNMSFNIQGDKDYAVSVEFERLSHANKFHEYVDQTSS